MPPTPPSSAPGTHLPPYPSHLSRRLPLVLLPLDITTLHALTHSQFHTATALLLRDPTDKSPLAEWTTAFLAPIFERAERSGEDGLALHDPLAVWYAMSSLSGEGWKRNQDEDIRVETMGQWTRGACVVDRRGKGKRKVDGDVDVEVTSDRGGWRDERKGNRVTRVIGSPFGTGGGEKGFAETLLRMMLAS